MAPTTPAPSPAKVCIVCRQDCSNRPRNKDEQGRYTCQDCAKKMATAGASRGGSASAAPSRPVVKSASAGGAPPVAAAAKQAAGRGAGAMDDGLHRLAADPLPAYMFEEKPVEVGADQEMCQNCGQLIKKSHVICIKCGHNKQNHKTLHTALKRPEIINDGKKSKTYFTLDNIYVVGGIWLSAALSVIFAIIAGSSGEPQMMALSLVVMMAVGAILGLACIIATFFESVLMGVLLLVFGVVNTVLPFGRFYVSIAWTCYTIYWMLCECDSAFVKHTYFASFLQGIMIVIMIMHFGARLTD